MSTKQKTDPSDNLDTAAGTAKKKCCHERLFKPEIKSRMLDSVPCTTVVLESLKSLWSLY